MQGTTQDGQGSQKILLVPPIFAETLAVFSSYLPDKWYNRYTIYRIDPLPLIPEIGIDLEKVLLLCTKLIEKANIQMVYADTKLANMVKAVLVQRFPGLKGPSLLPMAVASHKYYLSKLIDSSENAMPKELVNVDLDIFDSSVALLQRLPMPYMMRSGLGSGNSSYCCFQKDDVIEDLKSLHQDISKILPPLQKFLESNCNTEKFPELLKPVVLVSSYMNFFEAGKGSIYKKIRVEAAVYETTVIHWAIADSVSLPYGSEQPNYSMSGLFMPTNLSKFEQRCVYNRFDDDLKNLIKTGVNNTFVYASYLVFNDGGLELLTLDTSPQFRCAQMYSYALSNGNNIEAAFQLSRGIKPLSPTLSGKCSLMHDLTVAFVEGQISELIDFDKASKHSSVALKYRSTHEVLLAPAQTSLSLGYVTVSGESFDACFQQINDIRKQIIKHPQLVPL